MRRILNTSHTLCVVLALVGGLAWTLTKPTLSARAGVAAAKPRAFSTASNGDDDASVTKIDETATTATPTPCPVTPVAISYQATSSVFDIDGDTIGFSGSGDTAITLTPGVPQNATLYSSVNIGGHGTSPSGDFTTTFSTKITIDGGASQTFTRTFHYSVTSTKRNYTVDGPATQTLDLGAKGKLDITVNPRTSPDFCPNGSAIVCTLPAQHDDVTFLLHDVPGSGACFQLSASAYSVGEGAGSLVVTVTRAGSTSAAATVDYATAPDASVVGCDAVTGRASERCDFNTTLGTLRFAAGEASKTFRIFLTDDAYTEGDETFPVSLSNPTGDASLGVPSSATVTITDNDAGGPVSQFADLLAAANPIDSPPFFVRMHYVDFLSREPEAAGLSAWVSTLNNCKAGDAACDRVTVSANFFRSDEFFLKGYYVMRFYKVSLGANATYREFMRDSERVTADTSADVAAARAVFADEWTQRADFKAIYDSLSNQAYVDKLEQTAGVTLSNKSQLVSNLNAAAETRAQVLRDVVESPEVQRKMYNDAWVSMEYFGYLRRDAEPTGFNAWLNFLNAHPADWHSMVNGFVNSLEYRKRFGTP